MKSFCNRWERAAVVDPDQTVRSSVCNAGIVLAVLDGGESRSDSRMNPLNTGLPVRGSTLQNSQVPSLQPKKCQIVATYWRISFCNFKLIWKHFFWQVSCQDNFFAIAFWEPWRLAAPPPSSMFHRDRWKRRWKQIIELYDSSISIDEVVHLSQWLLNTRSMTHYVWFTK